MKLKFIIGVIATAGCFLTGKAQQDVSGTWLGILTLKERQQRIIFHLQKSGPIYSGSFDSPDEKKVKVDLAPGALPGASPDSIDAIIKNLPFDSVIIKKDSILLFCFQLPQPIYKGVIATDSTLKGKWGLEPTTFQLDMKRVRGKWEIVTQSFPCFPDRRSAVAAESGLVHKMAFYDKRYSAARF